MKSRGQGDRVGKLWQIRNFSTVKLENHLKHPPSSAVYISTVGLFRVATKKEIHHAYSNIELLYIILYYITLHYIRRAYRLLFDLTLFVCQIRVPLTLPFLLPLSFFFLYVFLFLPDFHFHSPHLFPFSRGRFRVP